MDLKEADLTEDVANEDRWSILPDRPVKKVTFFIVLLLLSLDFLFLIHQVAAKTTDDDGEEKDDGDEYRDEGDDGDDYAEKYEDEKSHQRIEGSSSLYIVCLKSVKSSVM